MARIFAVAHPLTCAAGMRRLTTPQMAQAGDMSGRCRRGVIAALLLGAQDIEAGYTPRVWLIGARIAGALCIPFAKVRVPLLLEHCSFDESPDLYWATLGFTSLRGSVLPGLGASNLSVGGHLRLSESSIAGEARLLSGTITGGLLLDGARLSNPGGTALDGERLRVRGGCSPSRRFFLRRRSAPVRRPCQRLARP